MTSIGDGFDGEFEILTGFKPFRWQRRLFDCLLETGLPSALDLPTGLGKTSVMAIWLLARAHGATLPRRLVYVVDRRAVVDQATEEAEKLRTGLEKLPKELKKSLGLCGRQLPISTLRGQFVDNRAWLADPAAPAIIIGTVDMIGSRLLFSGYGVSPKSRSNHAGLLGADALIVLDEAHLVPPFERLLEAVENGQDTFGPRSEEHRRIVPKFQLMSLSASGRERGGEVFRLSDTDLDDLVVAQRLNAPKRIKIEAALAAQDLVKAMADRAWERGINGRRVIVFCNSRKIAQAVHDDLTGRLKKYLKETLGKAAPEDGHLIQMIVGARRLYEREQLASSTIFRRFSPKTAEKEQLNAGTLPGFLVCTSAGEVGVDLDADHMVCDLVAWERMVQRFGRVNRLGKFLEGSLIDVFPALSDKDKEAEIAIDSKRIETWRAPFASEQWSMTDDGRRDASPGALRRLRGDPTFKSLADKATTPEPLRPALTRALVDAWSMTSLTEHAGRPDVGPWLRGWVDDEPQTSVVWRTYLPVRVEGGDASPEEIDGFFEAAPPHATETLQTETWRVIEWLTAREASVSKATQKEKQENEVDKANISDHELPEQPNEAVSEPVRGRDIVAFALSPAGELRKFYRLSQFAKDQVKKFEIRLTTELTGATLVVDARLKGLKNGLLDEAEDKELPRTADEEVQTGDDDLWHRPANGPPVVRFRVDSPRKPESAENGFIFATKRSEDRDELEVISIETWTTERSRAQSSHEQLLCEHQSWTKDRALRIAEAVGLSGPHEQALTVAAHLHDEGKQAKRWQRAFNAPHRDKAYAKTKGPINQNLLDGYRHEFGSLPSAEKDPEFLKLPKDLQDLVLHIVAAHHGRARPVIGTSGCDDAPPSALEDRARDVALRFVRVQKHWGPWGLAWWEALLRAADQQASEANEKRDEAPRRTAT